MKKVLLVTWWDNNNFGNRLQAIALKQMIDQTGYHAVCVPNTYTMPINWRIKQFVKLCLGTIGVKKYKYTRLRKKRINSLRVSSSVLLSPTTKQVVNFDPSQIINPNEYEGAVVGSDQVWHKWTNHSKELEFFYLNFMPQNKRISYAASFGFEIFPDEDQSDHINGLNGMLNISCREKTGCFLVNQHTNKDADLVLDPTLCVHRSFWDNIEKKPSYMKDKKFIFVMLLGKKELYYPYIKDYADKNSLDIIDLTDNDNQEVWSTTINNFIWLVHNAELICTDSFHCTVFSILYEKPLTIFHRQESGFEKMFDRINTLLDICDLHECEYNGESINDFCPNYKNAKERLSCMVEYSNKWLIDALIQLGK